MSSHTVSRFSSHSYIVLEVEDYIFWMNPKPHCLPLRQMAMLTRIHELVQQNSQFSISTHSPILMAYPDSIIYNLKPDGIEISSLEETDHYVIMREFINNKEKMLNQLFEA
ncbi:putative ATPase [Paenibacillus sp. V4I7]|nr:putative ATPase [Paenibacillus sp. V4I7]MDQ0914717.1 putative ATPase [Paenibacillus sp. V4I5]